MKHTQGWIVRSASDSDVCAIYDGGGELIGTCGSEHASLIAAAPELLSALKDCLLYLDQERFGPAENAPWDGNIREIINHAIARAEGR